MTARDAEFSEQLATTANNPTINSLAMANAENRLVLRPAFQRNLVWNKEQRSYLIDSILRNLPVPEVYLHITTDADGREELVVVDGQQRISACLEFLKDDLRMVGDDLDSRWRNRVFSELEEDLKIRFRSYQLLVRQLPRLDEPVLREIFRRLNRTVEPLEPQELRHAAYTGPYITFIEAAASHPAHAQIGVFSALDFRRRRSDELIAEITYASAVRAFPNKKEGLEESFLTYERYGFPPELRTELTRRFGRVLDQLEFVGPELRRRTRFRNKSDYYTLFGLLVREADLLPLDEPASSFLVQRLQDLTDAITELRRLEQEVPDAEATGLVDSNVAKYTRAVERAASDRLNRVRRDEVLREWLGPVLARSSLTALGASDETWLAVLTEAEDDDESEAELEAERVRFKDVLLNAPEDI